MTPLAAQLAEEIRLEGPLTVARFMQACLFDPRHGYYAARPALGPEGDFLTAPETSQMFGELLGLWCVHEWTQMGAPSPVHWVEFGPGRGVLMADAWRATAVSPSFRAAVQIWLIDPSLPLRRMQAAALGKVGAVATWVDRLEEVPEGPTLILANEVLDCLPIRQFVATAEGWRERLIGLDDAGALGFGLSHPVAPAPGVPEGWCTETAPDAERFLGPIAARLHAHPGRALFLDYGYAEPQGADTLQALRRHEKLPPLAAPGDSDLTAQVNFAEVQERAQALGLACQGPEPQGRFLRSLGLDQRAAALAAKHPDRHERLSREHHRLTAPDQMGELFKALCLSSPELPPPAGFFA